MIIGNYTANTIEKKIWEFLDKSGIAKKYNMTSEVHLSIDATQYYEVFINMLDRNTEPNEAEQRDIIAKIQADLGDTLGGYVPFFARGFEQDGRIPNIMTPAFPKLNPGLYSAILEKYDEDPFPGYNPDVPSQKTYGLHA